MGVPYIGCACAVCTSADPRNKRLRSALLIRSEGATVLVDCGPDFRQQALSCGLRQLDAVILTHGHADHVFGLDDLRLLVIRRGRAMPVYGSPATLDTVRRVFAYAFAPRRNDTFVPRLDLREVPDGPFDAGGLEFTPVPVEHADEPTLGLRIGDFAYLPDVKRLPDASLAMLSDLDALVIDGLRYKPHPTHLCVEEACALIAALRPRRAWLTHLTHDIDYETDSARLPPNIGFAYDGLTIPIIGYAPSTSI